MIYLIENKLPIVIKNRLKGLLKVMIAHWESGGGLATAIIGREREIFINTCLSQIFSPAYRFGSGAIIDQAGTCSGQMDIVIENALMPSLPSQAWDQRLYLAEAVAAVIEVKSNLNSNEQTKCKTSCAKLKEIKRRYGRGIYFSQRPEIDIPYFVVTYEGIKGEETIKKYLDDIGASGILNIKDEVFLKKGPPDNDGHRFYLFKEELSVWGLICCLFECTTNLIFSGSHPLSYNDPTYSLDQWPLIIDSKVECAEGIMVSNTED